AELRDRNRVSTNPRLLRIDLCQQDRDSGPGRSFVWIASIVPITFLRWIRAPHTPFSDQRNCQTAGPSLRLTIARLPRCIVILLRHGLAHEKLHASAATGVSGSHHSELLCGGSVLGRNPETQSDAQCDNFRIADHPGVTVPWLESKCRLRLCMLW